MQHYDYGIRWKIQQEQDRQGHLFWTFGRFELIPHERRIIWRWIENGEWQGITLLKL